MKIEYYNRLNVIHNDLVFETLKTFIVLILDEDFVGESCETTRCFPKRRTSLQGKVKSGGQMVKDWIQKAFSKIRSMEELRWIRRMLGTLACVLVGAGALTVSIYYPITVFLTICNVSLIHIHIVGPLVLINF